MPETLRDERRISLRPNVELRIRKTVDPRQPSIPVIDLRLYRRSPSEVSPDFHQVTAAGFCLPVQFAPLVAEYLAALTNEGS